MPGFEEPRSNNHEARGDGGGVESNGEGLRNSILSPNNNYKTRQNYKSNHFRVLEITERRQ